MMQNIFNKFLNYNYEDSADQLNTLAESHNMSINVIPDGVGNIDIEDNRVNIWVEQSTGKIYKVTIG
jgi:hypothetical protein